MQAEIAKLDYMQLLPLFLDGIRETEDPFRFLAVKVKNCTIYTPLQGSTLSIMYRLYIDAGPVRIGLKQDF